MRRNMLYSQSYNKAIIIKNSYANNQVFVKKNIM